MQRRKEEKETLKPKEYNTEIKRFSLARLADIVTLMNGVCGSMSVLTAIEFAANQGTVSDISPDNLSTLRWCLFLPFLGLFFDFFDGKVARWKNESSMLGQELDSLADLVSFGVAPASIGYIIGLRHFVDKVILSIFVCAGLARLARFNVTTHLIPKDEKGKSTHFEGLPIPTSLALVALIWFWIEFGFLKNGVPFGEFEVRGHKVHTFSILWAIWAAAMTSRTLKVPKL